jgi:hypothetical protein
MPDDEFDSDAFLDLDDSAALAPIQPEPPPEYSEGCIRVMIEYEQSPTDCTWHQCKCGRSGCRGRMCWQCWGELLTKATG